MAKKPGVVIYHSFTPSVLLLPMEQRGELFTAILDYSTGRNAEPEFSGEAATVWEFIRQEIDTDNAKYEEKCAKNAQNIRKRYERIQPNTSVNGRIPIQSNTIQSNPVESNPVESNPVESNPNPKGAASALSVFIEFSGEDEELLDTLKAFHEMRKKIRAPLTHHAAELILDGLQKFDRTEWVPILNQSIANSWRGIFPLRQNDGHTDRRGTSTADILADMAKEGFFDDMG